MQIGTKICASFLKNHLFNQEVCLVVDSQVAALYQLDIGTWLNQSPPKKRALFVFPCGENNKNVHYFQQLIQFLVEHQFSRSLNIIAIGGGVVGDLAGFVAATYLRGVNFIYCPTTLLAQVDASIGGKTAINLPQGKNLLGVFYPPKQVICDIDYLRTLPEREFRSGLAEAVKHGLVCSAAYFDWLKENADAILSREPAILITLVAESIRLKAEIVAKDTQDHACRQWLNFGHTLGHAIESATDYGHYLHGEAVAIGMVVAMKLSEQQFKLSSEIVKKLIDLLTKFGLPIDLGPTNLEIDRLLSYLKLDKKKRAERVNWVLLKGIGHPVLTEDVLDTQLRQILLMLGAR